ncbi:hypothetical protein JRQ81_008056 [Phrynocephalus forsythii]|uniref:SPIN-DOC-like zinc-finger domain-containing protein n=1 Tax=Phrynocephalus forsythii TaxID=171643 RepID=A0A9Q0Y4R6_9SAUR|nr:hypothetical protein JRQ81_008056 [Phrynocephalus forsythii]
MAKCKAKRKYEDEHRTFLEEWEDAFFFIERNGKALCLICNTMISHFKASNLQRHFRTLHANIDKELPKGGEQPEVIALANSSSVTCSAIGMPPCGKKRTLGPLNEQEAMDIMQQQGVCAQCQPPFYHM